MNEAPILSGQGRKVLAVDDEEEILQLYNTFLKFRGFEIKAVKNANDCIDYLMKNKADIILLDVNMPGIDGLKLLEMIRTQPSSKETPIIMISARGDESTVKKAATLGCDNFLVKPFALADLAERIQSELFTINYDEARALLMQARNVKTRLIREPGLQDYRVLEWDPYYIKNGGMEICVMVPRGVRPESLARLEEAPLSKRVVILNKHQIRWKKLWPKD